MEILPLVVGARNSRQAVAAVMDARGLDEESAHALIGKELARAGWALLIAPELWCVLEEWFACRRLERDAQRMRRLRNRVQRAAEDPDVLSVIEVSSGKVLAIPDQARVMGEIKIGPDVLSVRASAVAKVQAEITRIEDSLGRRRKALHEYVQAYQARVLVVEGMTLQQQAAALMRLSLVQGQQALAFELAQVATKSTASADVDGLLKSLATRVQGLFGG